MPKLVESWWDLNDDGRTVVANNRLKCQSNGEINPNKVYSRSTLPKATPTTNKSSTDYNTIDIIAIYVALKSIVVFCGGKFQNRVPIFISSLV